MSLTRDKLNKIWEVENELELERNSLVAVIAFESAGTFDPQVRNKFSGAVGLIQFTKMGLTSVPDYDMVTVATMTFEEQLVVVKEYLQANGLKKLRRQYKQPTLCELYLMVFAPSFVGKDMDSKVYSDPSKSYKQNKYLDTIKKGYITKRDICSRITKHSEQFFRANKLFKELINEAFLKHCEGE